MKLFFALADYGLGIGGRAFPEGEPRQGELRFCDGLLISNLFANSQRFLVRLAGRLQIPLIDKDVSSSSECNRHGTFVVNLLCDGSGLLVTSKGFFQFTTPSLHFGKVGERERDAVLVSHFLVTRN